MKKFTYLMITLMFALLTTQAEARHRVRYADPGCNVIFPCEGVVTSARGERVVKAMGGFGTARKHYVHHSRHTPRFEKKPVREASKPPSSGNGVVRAASGAVAYVAKEATGAFQCLVDALESVGYKIHEMGGFADHGHIRHSFHYRGMALDVNQMSRNVTKPAMPSNEIELANKCGLVSGAQWRDADSGHFQLGGYAGNKNTRYAHHHATRYARRVHNEWHLHRRHRYATR